MATPTFLLHFEIKPKQIPKVQLRIFPYRGAFASTIHDEEEILNSLMEQARLRKQYPNFFHSTPYQYEHDMDFLYDHYRSYFAQKYNIKKEDWN